MPLEISEDVVDSRWIGPDAEVASTPPATTAVSTAAPTVTRSRTDIHRLVNGMIASASPAESRAAREAVSTTANSAIGMNSR